MFSQTRPTNSSNSAGSTNSTSSNNSTNSTNSTLGVHQPLFSEAHHSEKLHALGGSGGKNCFFRGG